jgi:hypothetical protein
VVIEIDGGGAHRDQPQDARHASRRAMELPSDETHEQRIGDVQRRHRAEDVVRSAVEAAEELEAEPGIHARQVRALARLRREVDGATVRVEVPRRGRWKEVIGQKSEHVEREEPPGESPRRLVIAEEEVERVPERHEQVEAVGNGEHPIEQRCRPRLEPVVHRHALAVDGHPEESHLEGAQIAQVHGSLADADVLHESHRVVDQAGERERQRDAEHALARLAPVGEKRHHDRHRHELEATFAARETIETPQHERRRR